VQTVIRPLRFAMSIAITPFFDRLVNVIQVPPSPHAPPLPTFSACTSAAMGLRTLGVTGRRSAQMRAAGALKRDVNKASAFGYCLASWKTPRARN
jgi:hypothetical protein